MVKLFYSKKRIRKLFRKNFETESSLHQRLNQSLMLILLMTLRIGKKFITCHNVCLGDKDSRISVQITKQMPCDRYLLMQNWYYTISNVLLMWWIGWITLAQHFLSCQVLGSEVIKWLVDHKFNLSFRQRYTVWYYWMWGRDNCESYFITGKTIPIFLSTLFYLH